MATVAAEALATCWATADTVESNSSSGTTCETNPCARASSALMASPVSNIRMAILRLTARLSATIRVEQNKPMRTPGVANRADVAATARSHVAASWHHAADAKLFTFAITGWVID